MSIICTNVEEKQVPNAKPTPPSAVPALLCIRLRSIAREYGEAPAVDADGVYCGPRERQAVIRADRFNPRNVEIIERREAWSDDAGNFVQRDVFMSAHDRRNASFDDIAAVIEDALPPKPKTTTAPTTAPKPQRDTRAEVTAYIRKPRTGVRWAAALAARRAAVYAYSVGLTYARGGAHQFAMAAPDDSIPF